MQSLILTSLTGLYECTLRGRAMYLSQNGRVTGNIIKQAPNVQLQNNVNVKCVEEKIQQLQCCVQSPYKVKWFQNTAVLLTGKYVSCKKILYSLALFPSTYFDFDTDKQCCDIFFLF